MLLVFGRFPTLFVLSLQSCKYLVCLLSSGCAIVATVIAAPTGAENRRGIKSADPVFLMSLLILLAPIEQMVRWGSELFNVH